MRNTERNKEHDDNIRLHRRNGKYEYLLSDDFVKLGGYIFDYKAHNIGANPIVHCDTQEFVDIVNKHYETATLVEQRSATIIGSNDPKLMQAGIPYYDSPKGNTYKEIL